MFTDVSRLEGELPRLEGENIINIEEFNAGIDRLNETLYGSQDYAVIAKKD